MIAHIPVYHHFYAYGLPAVGIERVPDFLIPPLADSRDCATHVQTGYAPWVHQPAQIPSYITLAVMCVVMREWVSAVLCYLKFGSSTGLSETLSNFMKKALPLMLASEPPSSLKSSKLTI